jgi:hypothetical protein
MTSVVFATTPMAAIHRNFFREESVPLLPSSRSFEPATPSG